MLCNKLSPNLAAWSRSLCHLTKPLSVRDLGTFWRGSSELKSLVKLRYQPGLLLSLIWICRIYSELTHVAVGWKPHLTCGVLDRAGHNMTFQNPVNWEREEGKWGEKREGAMDGYREGMPQKNTKIFCNVIQSYYSITLSAVGYASQLLYGVGSYDSQGLGLIRGHLGWYHNSWWFMSFPYTENIHHFLGPPFVSSNYYSTSIESHYEMSSPVWMRPVGINSLSTIFWLFFFLLLSCTFDNQQYNGRDG